MADGSFHIIVITSPGFIEDEALWITRLLDAGVNYVHIRKPGWDENKVRNLLLQIPQQFRSRLTLHDYYNLAQEGLVGGIHLNSRNFSAFIGDFRVSRSCHSLDETELFRNLDYVTLSPIFDSISKPGYNSAFNLELIKPELEGKRIIALGGVDCNKFAQLKDVGFEGAALLGAVWQTDDMATVVQNLSEAHRRYNP